MEADKCISTSNAATEKNHLDINDLDDDSLGMIFNKLPFIDRTRIKNVCQRWYTVSEANWCTYSKRLRIGEDTGNLLPSYANTTEMENILKKILQRSGPFLEEITFKRDCSFFESFRMGTIKWIAKRCPKLKRLNTGSLMLNDDDWLACSNLEALSFTSFAIIQQGNGLGILFRSNKRLRRLEIFSANWLTASDFDHLDPGQLKFLQTEYCRNFKLTAQVADKLAESLVELRYSTLWCSISKIQHLGKLKNLRSLDLKVRMEWLEIEMPIADIAQNCRKLEFLFLAISADQACDQNILAPLFGLPHLRRLIIIVDDNEMTREERDRLLQRTAHIEFFVLETCAKCEYGTQSFDSCDRHRRGWLS